MSFDELEENRELMASFHDQLDEFYARFEACRDCWRNNDLNGAKAEIKLIKQRCEYILENY